MQSEEEGRPSPGTWWGSRPTLGKDLGPLWEAGGLGARAGGPWPSVLVLGGRGRSSEGTGQPGLCDTRGWELLVS